MNRRFLLVIAFSVLLLSYVLGYISWGMGETDGPRSSEDIAAHPDDQLVENKNVEKKLASLQRKIDQMTLKQQAMEHRQRVNDGDIEDLSNRIEQGNDEGDLPESPSEGQGAPDVAETQMVLLDSKMAEDGRDPEWSDEAEHGIVNSIRKNNLPNLVSEEVTCSTNICKVTLDFGGRQGLDWAMQQNFQELTKLAPWNSGGFFRSDEKDNLNLYFPREGSELPRVPQEE